MAQNTKVDRPELARDVTETNRTLTSVVTTQEDHGRQLAAIWDEKKSKHSAWHSFWPSMLSAVVSALILACVAFSGAFQSKAAHDERAPHEEHVIASPPTPRLPAALPRLPEDPMAKTRRRAAYRKTKRWNPRGYRAQRLRGRRSLGAGRHMDRHFQHQSLRKLSKWSRIHTKWAKKANPKRRYFPQGHDPRRGSVRGMLMHLGQMNPRGRRRGGRAFTKHRSGRKWESTVAGSLPYWANPKRGHRGSRRKARHSHAHLVRGGGKHKVYEFRSKKRGKGRRDAAWLRIRSAMDRRFFFFFFFFLRAR